MWVLVVVLINGGASYVFTDNVLYTSYKDCSEDAQHYYELYMTTRPDPDATAVVWCTEKPKGI
jgi:hypothetical protein